MEDGNVVNGFIIGIAITAIVFFALFKSPENPDFKENYRIDLKENGYLIYKSYNGDTVFVPRDSLELFFLNDNL